MLNHSTPCYTEINSNFDPTAMEGETFLPVPGYEGHYSVSNYGRIISHKGKQPRVIKGRRDSIGYVNANLCRDGKQKTSLVHRIVAQAHLGPATVDKPHVLHANDVKADNRAVNLRYGTSSDNHRDRVLNGGCPQANKTHCKRGHAFVAANTHVRNGGRKCISCSRAHTASYRAEKTDEFFDFHEHALSVYTSLTSAPGADMTPVISTTLAQAVNLRRGTQAKTTRDTVINGGSPKANRAHCKHGHAFVVANTRVEAGGSRKCISCQRARAYVQYSKKIGRALNFIEDADRRFIEITTAPGADLTPVLSASLAA